MNDSDKIPKVAVMLDNYEDLLVSVLLESKSVYSYLGAQSILLAQQSLGALTTS
jgi:hypothetical protein